MISRRDFIRASFVAGFSSLAFGSVLEHVHPQLDSDFLPLFLERYRAYQDRFFPSLWSREFQRAWKEDFARPEDFVQDLFGWAWPRFQWAYEFGERLTPAFQWCDWQNPDRLQDNWKKSMGAPPIKNFGGVHWNALETSYLEKQKSGVVAHRFQKSKKTGEERWEFSESVINAFKGDKKIWTQTFPRPILPANRTPDATLWQRRVAHEFMMGPHAQRLSWIDRREWLFFP